MDGSLTIQAWLLMGAWLAVFLLGKGLCAGNRLRTAANATLGRPNDYSSYSQEKLASGLNVIAGLWLIISPWVLHDQTQQAYTNNVMPGIVIAVLAAIRAGGAGPRGR